MGNEAWNKIHQVAWKFKTQNLVVTCTLNLRKNLEYFPKSILVILYIISKLGKSRVQLFKLYTNWSWNEVVMVIKDNCTKLKNHSKWFRIQFMNSKSNMKLPNFKFTHCHFGVSSLPPQKLHLRHSFSPKWAPRG